MSSSPSAPDGPIGRLLADGYVVALRNGHLLIQQIPYLSASGLHLDGVLVLPINDSGGDVADAIGDHTIWFAGKEPRDERGSSLAGASHRDLGDGLAVDYTLSFKPPKTGRYGSLHDKVRSYARILQNPAQRVGASVTATPGAAFQSVEDDLPLVYRDTNATRAGLVTLSNLFRGHTIVIVGIGGTGSYILDQVAKTWVDRIILIDGDEFENHNAFRAPGAASISTLQLKPNKAEYFAEEYSRMHTGITAHPEYLTTQNLHLLDGATFVFLAAADAGERATILAAIRDRGVPFIDVGLGVSQSDNGLTGLVKTTTYLPDDPTPLPAAPATLEGDDYGSNIQIADLNALNALQAVIAWKRHIGFYATLEPMRESVYKLYVNEIRNG